jgi:hypothetical protein
MEKHEAAIKLQLPPTHPTSRQKLPVTPAILASARATLNLTDQHQCTIWGATVLGYFFLLRRSEYAATNGVYTPYALQVRDIQFYDDQGKCTNDFNKIKTVAVTLRGSKTDQTVQGQARKLEASGEHWLCPVGAAWMLHSQATRQRRDQDEPLCASTIGRPVTSIEIANLIKMGARMEGHEPTQYSTHSLRSGGATAMFGAGTDGTTIQLFGRWKSDAFKTYTRASHAATSQLAKAMAQDH